MAGARTGGRIVADALVGHGIERVYCVPGESHLPLLDAFYDLRDRLTVITCRHEHGAGFMAEAEAKLGGRAGVCLVTRGPGACNASIAVHTAFQDQTPLLLLVGQVVRAWRGREAFQEVEFRQMFGPLAKHVEEVADADALPEAMARALHLAVTGRPGPVVLVLPADVLAELSDADDVARLPVDSRAPDPGLMERCHQVLGDAQRPLVIAGGSGWTAQARADFARFVADNGLPVACSFRRNDILDNASASYVGELGVSIAPGLLARVREADVILAVGTRLGEIVTQGYTLFAADGVAADGPALIHVHPDPAVLGRLFRPAVAIPASVAAFTAAARRLVPCPVRRWQAWAAAARADHLADRTAPPAGDTLDPAAVMGVLDALLPADAIISVDAGNFSTWPQRHLRFGGGRRLLGPCNGAMGYAVPAAIAAKLASPTRTTVACVGDGSFGMTGGELATAVRYGADIVVLIGNNAMYGTIRTHQERLYPKRVVATGLTNPDFVALARAYGAHGERVERGVDFAAAFGRAVGAGRPAVIELPIDPDLLSSRLSLQALRTGGRGRAGAR